MLHRRISLNLVLLLLIVNIVGGFSLELMFIATIVSIKSSLTHLHGFQLLALLPELIEITFIVVLLNLKQSLGRLVAVAKRFLELPNLCILIKEKSLTLFRNLALMIFGKLVIVFITKVNLQYFFYSMGSMCCRLSLIKKNCFLKIFLTDLVLIYSGISLSDFLSKTNLKLHNIM